MHIAVKALIPIILFSTWTTEATSHCTISNLQWLNGSWLRQSEKSLTSETWKRVSEYTMEGIGYTQKTGTDQRQYESMRLVSMSNELFFIAKVAHNVYPVAFAATHCTATSVRFENAEHDFPNVLHYQLKQAQLHVDVAGSDGKGFTLIFHRQD